MIQLIKAFLAKWFGSKPYQKTNVKESPPSLAWGSRVSADFRDKVHEISKEIGVKADFLMAVMAFESARTFRPDVKNMAGSGATGLIQFMPSTAVILGTTTEKLAAMSAVQQLDYVRAYFWPYRGRLNTLSDVYMAVLWPGAIGKPEDYVLWTREGRPKTYRQNAGLDINKDGSITKAEAAQKVFEHLQEGRNPVNISHGE